jgi:APA family basic amino acid/polyamine antiporter
VIALALASSVGAMIMAGSRVYEAMGSDYRALSFLARRNARGAPVSAVAVQSALALGMLATSSFGALLGFIGFTLSATAGLTVLGVPVLRIREPHLERPYRTWACPLTPLLFVALSAWMIGHSLVERPASSFAGVGVIAAALALYALVSRAGHPAASEALPDVEGDP